MRNVAYILLVIFGFLFLHSETGLFKDCNDHHAGHDVCIIFQNSDNIRTSSFGAFHNIEKILSTAFLEPLISKCNHDIIHIEKNSDLSPHRLKKKKLIHFLNSLII